MPGFVYSGLCPIAALLFIGAFCGTGGGIAPFTGKLKLAGFTEFLFTGSKIFNPFLTFIPTLLLSKFLLSFNVKFTSTPYG